MEYLSRITHVIADVLVKISAFGLVLMTAIVGWQVFGRYVLNSTPSWSEQAALTLMIWYVSLAAAAGVRQGFHIRIVALEEAVPPAVRKVMQVMSNTIVGACGVAMLIWGGELVMRTWSHVIPSLGISRGLAYLGLPIAGALMALFAFERTLEVLAAKTLKDEEDPRWN
ncbi:MAG: TRAP transporter small permease [Hyphomonas sp.]|uniref:TRAP transporter small permease n=1 Tax=Hyphomonas sp. TaxID=87 RepID=UPI0017B5F249|nr:TRAP transporter small permease [Hyphomonas sp.]MBU3920982.1 TRAP transporter small permease [Alphaproteobacteria bacterium]MBA3069940.1 TRAP transporter small permease [Hyphomonas sp.]MBU4060484.1 TRAP transporter small permease [Alphaproteobacteria bacterium]MBU4163152.1 TRAP transporter small permease [Alphaproteobacteria bacterium]MBU4568117.1 TRAP transporter small permease [Alphaproteobacteria bacterium]